MSRRRCSRAPARRSRASASPASAKSSSTARRAAAPPITQIGPQGCPVVPATLGRPRRPAQQRAGADRPHPAPDRAADRAAQRQEPERDFRHSREYRRDHQGARASARPNWATRSARSGSPPHNAGDRRQQRRGADRQHQPAGQRAGPAGRGESATRRSPRSQQAADNLDAMITDARPGVQNFSKSTLPEANQLVRDLRELSQSLQGVIEPREPAGHRRRARAREAARLQARETQMKLLTRTFAPAALAAGARRLLARRLAGRRRKPPTTLLTLTPQAPTPVRSRAPSMPARR